MAEPIIFIKPVGDSLKQGTAVSMNFMEDEGIDTIL